MIYKTINTKLKIEQPEPTKTEVNTGSLTGKAVPASLTNLTLTLTQIIIYCDDILSCFSKTTSVA